MNNTALTAAEVEALAHMAMADGERPFSVNLWGSHPDEENDDCWTGFYFDTRELAEAFMANIKPVLDAAYRLKLSLVDTYFHLNGTTHLELDGEGVNAVVQIAKSRRKSRNVEMRRELAMEAGMLGGCDAYNDFMGY